MSEGDDGTISWRELRDEARRRLPEVEARWVVEEASGWSGADLLAHLDDKATVRGVAHLDAMVARRLAGEPLQHCLGRWAFRSLDLMVDARALIPRPETEGLVDLALEGLGPDALAVDLGTGTGAIALSLAAEHDTVQVWATDASPDALALARANLAGLGGRAATRVRLVEGDWFAALPAELAGCVTVVVANPPYVGDDEVLPPEVADWEPERALRSGPDGLDAITAITAEAARWLAPGGTIAVEIGETQGHTAAGLAAAGGLVDVDVRHDLTGRDRYLTARRPI